MKVGLITYNYPHLKTEQVVTGLMNREDGTNYVMYALPFKPRKSRSEIIKHRPYQFGGMHTKKLSERYSIPYFKCEKDTDINSKCDYYLILGASLLSVECVRDKKIINCHSGIIPNSRGLDSFKWCIYYDRILGVTLHKIDENIDSGEILAIVKTHRNTSDTIYTLIERHYQNEIKTLVNHFEYMAGCYWKEILELEKNEPTMRMSKTIERETLKRFNYAKRKVSNS